MSPDSSTQHSRHVHLQGPSVQPDGNERKQATVPRGSQQDILKRQNTGGSDFSGSSSSTWSQSDRMQSILTGCRRCQCAELVGRGAFGSVYKGTWKGRPAAIKVRASYTLDAVCCIGLRQFWNTPPDTPDVDTATCNHAHNQALYLSKCT